MSKDKTPVTQAIRQLRRHNIVFTPHCYRYLAGGGTAGSASELRVDEHLVIKTLVMEDELKEPLLILMHGDLEVSQKNLARQIGVKLVQPCAAHRAEQLTAYQTGGISPFGTRKSVAIYIEKTIMALDKIYINGGKRGFLIKISPADLAQVLKPTEVAVGI